MKTPQMEVYSIARHYLNDNAHHLCDDLVDRILGSIRSRDHKALAGVTQFVDMHSADIHHWRILRQIEAFFKKNDDFAVDSECKDAALASFNRGEKICRIANRRLDYYYTQRDRIDPDLRKLIDRSEAFIAKVLGAHNDFLEEVPTLLKLTGGASALTSRRLSVPFMKLGRKPAVTPNCLPYLSAVYRHYGYRPTKGTVVGWNRLEFVPKSWKTHRTIACEPAANQPFQLAFDTYCKRRLRKHGVDLASQEKNQQHAYQGSVNQKFATVDLSMASDTVAYNTVAWLLPQSWFKYLDRVRSPLFRLEGRVGKYAKFSSMGNGATFALETLIFLSFIRAAGSKHGVAYGDDLTIEPEFAPDLFKLLRFFGFVPNVDKSFTGGPFRESCGKDYYEGIDITPFYVRSTRAWDKPYACHNVNGLANVSTHGDLWKYLVEFVNLAKLPLTPFTHNTLAGVLIHPHTAYKLNLIRTKDGIIQSKQYLRIADTAKGDDYRSLVAWHVDRLGRLDDALTATYSQISIDANLASRVARELGKAQLEKDENSRYATLEPMKYRRKWVGWTFPSTGAPEDLFRFSELLYRPSG